MRLITMGKRTDEERRLERLTENGAIVQFYGLWCPHCLALWPAVKRLRREEGVTVNTLEVWVRGGNRRLMASLADLYKEFNEGNFTVPSFYDPWKPREQRLLANPRSYRRLRDWATGVG